MLDALQHAIRDRQPAPGLIHHSDRGGQYAGHAYRAVLRRAAIRQSMSRAANCYDNAFMESCFGTIKTELEMTEYENSRQARHDIASYLAYYNTAADTPPWTTSLPLLSRTNSPSQFKQLHCPKFAKQLIPSFRHACVPLPAAAIIHHLQVAVRA